MSATESPTEILARLDAEKRAGPPVRAFRLALAIGRDHHPTALERAALLHLIANLGVTELHHGDAIGDRRLAAVPLSHGIPVPIVTHPAAWSALGRAAGPIRTKQMLTRVHALAAGPGGHGTTYAVEEARRQGRQVFILAEVARILRASLSSTS